MKNDQKMDLDLCLSTLKEFGKLTESQVMELLEKISEVLFQENTILTLNTPIAICGDIHGQLMDMFELFSVSGGVENNVYLFLGDYVDRGYYSLETFMYLVALKLKYPEKVYLLRGNHESRAVNLEYGFYNACINAYGHTGVWTACNDVFDLLPVAALVDNKILGVHGGLSPNIKIIEQIPLINRRVELPTSGPLCDLCWSDPDETVEGWEKNARGAGYLFGQKAADEFMHNNRLTLLTRAHQLAMDGYQYHFHDDKVLTVWSAPNYMYRSGNKAIVLKIDADGHRDYVFFDAIPSDKQVVPKDPTSPYFA